MDGTFVDDIRAQADRDPRAPALVTPDAVVSYGDLVSRIDDLAGSLVAAGLGAERICVVALEPGVDAVVAIAAATRAGGAFLTVDIGLPAARLAAMARGGHLLLTRSGLTPPVDAPTVLVDRPGPRAPLPPPAPPRSLAYVSHTSGSTGAPNAVLVEHRGLRSYLRFIARDYGLGPHTTTLQVAPPGYDASIRDTFAPLVAGGRVVLLPRAGILTAEGFLDAIDRFGANTVLSTTPSFLTFLTRHPDAAHRLTGLRLVVSSGESLRPFLTAGGRSLLAGELVNQYGPTECTMTSTRHVVPTDPDPVDLVGTPIDGVTVDLLDHDLTPVPDGEVGEVFIGGVGLARGYADPALTADRFVPAPGGARRYRTGDLARRYPGGALEYLGRADRQLKIRGHRVDPAEIEGALLSHPDITGAAVTPATDDQGRAYLIAHITGNLDGTTDPALRAHLATTLPPHMMPRRFTRVSRIPTTRTGKTDRRTLAAATTPTATTPTIPTPNATTTPGTSTTGTATAIPATTGGRP